MLASFALRHLCRILSRDKHSLEFVVTRNFMKVFRTGSINVVNGCRKYFDFLPTPYRIDIRTAEFLEHILRQIIISVQISTFSNLYLSPPSKGGQAPLKPR